MFELFLNLSNRRAPSMRPGQWNYVMKGLKRNVEKVQQYYQAYNPTVRSNHFLIRLLQTFSVPHGLPLDRYYANVDRLALNHAMNMGMTSSISKGRVFRGIFYGGNTPEVLIAVDDHFDYEHVYRNWERVAAVQPLMHAKSDTELLLPNGQASSEEEGLTVILVNVPMLAVQYHAFLNAQANRMRGTLKTDAHFIAAYVLPNMLPKHMELAVFNRVYQHATQPDHKSVLLRQHPFYLPEYDYYLNDTIETFLFNIERTPLEFQTILKSLPSVNFESMYEAMEMPDVFPTRQVDWALTMARMKVVDLLFRLAKPQLLAKNRVHVNQMVRAFARHDVWMMAQHQLPPDAMREMRYYFDNIREGAQQDFF